MKKVFKITTEEIKGELSVNDRLEYHIFAKDMLEAVKKVLDCSSKGMKITKAELYCKVEEDKDLEEYKEE